MLPATRRGLQVRNTLSMAFASEVRVPSDGEVWPFSIFDNMPVDNFACLANAATVRLSRLRELRTCFPIAISSASTLCCSCWAGGFGSGIAFLML